MKPTLETATEWRTTGCEQIVNFRQQCWWKLVWNIAFKLHFISWHLKNRAQYDGKKCSPWNGVTEIDQCSYRILDFWYILKLLWELFGTVSCVFIFNDCEIQLTAVKMSVMAGSSRGPRLQEYIFTDKLGRGTYATVYKAFRKVTKIPCSANRLVGREHFICQSGIWICLQYTDVPWLHVTDRDDWVRMFRGCMCMQERQEAIEDHWHIPVGISQIPIVRWNAPGPRIGGIARPWVSGHIRSRDHSGHGLSQWEEELLNCSFSSHAHWRSSAIPRMIPAGTQCGQRFWFGHCEHSHCPQQQGALTNVGDVTHHLIKFGDEI